MYHKRRALLTCPTAEFCLLEQILPDGPGHPFAQSMIAHLYVFLAPKSLDIG